jgi:hypothetical protein
MSATCTPPGQEPVVYVDASADPPTVELPVPDGTRAPAQLPPGRVPGGAPGVSRRVREVVLALAIGLVLLAGSIAAVLFGTSLVEEARAEDQTPAAAPAALTFPGTVTLADPVVGPPTFALYGGTCAGNGRYADVHEGAPVTVSAPDGAVLGTARLDEGRPSLESEPTECTFSFTAADVPPGPSFYLVEVGQHGALTYTAQDLLRYGAMLRLGE